MRFTCCLILLIACDSPRRVIIAVEGEGEGESDGEGEPPSEGEGEIIGEGEGEGEAIVIGEGEGEEGEGEPPPRPTRYLDGGDHAPMTSFVVDHLRGVRAAHPELRNDVVAKIGDSLTVSTSYLQCFSGTNINLDGRDLDDTRLSFLTTIDSYRRVSSTATVGWSASAALVGDPSPIDDELAAISPGFATVMFGTNDVGFRTLSAFTNDIHTIIERLLSAGVVPLLSTIPPRDDDAAVDARVPAFNLAIRAVAEDHQVPFVDVGATLRALPGHGLGSDNIHLEQDSRGACVLDDAGIQHGYNLRNLLVLESLDRVRRSVVADQGAPDGDGPNHVGDGSASAPILIDGLPFTFAGNTSLSTTRTRDVWTECSNADESGPELFFEISLATAARIQVRAISRTGSDVDVHHVINGQCQARDDVELELDLAAGVHQFVVDSYQGDALAGPFWFMVNAT
jgi:hypothetical protein